MALDEIRKSLDMNPSLDEDMKICLMDLITLFHNKFPNVDLTNLKERLKSLAIIRGSKFLITKSSSYNPLANEMLINLVKINDDVDCRHILMREILNIITAKDNFTGFNKDNAYEALNVGYTEILTNYLVGNESESEYEDEIVATNMIASIVGNDNLFNAYFNNDVTLIMNSVC